MTAPAVRDLLQALGLQHLPDLAGLLRTGEASVPRNAPGYLVGAGWEPADRGWLDPAARIDWSLAEAVRLQRQNGALRWLERRGWRVTRGGGYCPCVRDNPRAACACTGPRLVFWLYVHELRDPYPLAGRRYVRSGRAWLSALRVAVARLDVARPNRPELGSPLLAGTERPAVAALVAHRRRGGC